MYAAAGQKTLGSSRSPSPAAAAAGEARHPATISRRRTRQSVNCALRTLQALQHEGYVGRGEVTVISDGAEIMKRLPKALPKPTAHILDWFHIAMKIQPLQQMADHVVRTSANRRGHAISIGDDIRSVKWKLWHGQTDRAIDRLEKIMAVLTIQSSHAEASAKRPLDARAALAHLRSLESRRHRQLRRTLPIGPTDCFLARWTIVARQAHRFSHNGESHRHRIFRSCQPNERGRQLRFHDRQTGLFGPRAAPLSGADQKCPWSSRHFRRRLARAWRHRARRFAAV